MKNLILCALVALPLCSCASDHPSQDPNPAKVEQYHDLLANRERALARLEAAEEAAQAAPSSENHRALLFARQDYEAAEREFSEWETTYYHDKYGPVVQGIATTIGAWNPAAQGVALGLGGLALNAVVAVSRKRGRKHAKRAIGRLANPKTKFEPLEAAADIARMMGWKHSSEKTEQVFEAEVQAPAEPKPTATT